VYIFLPWHYSCTLPHCIFICFTIDLLKCLLQDWKCFEVWVVFLVLLAPHTILRLVCCGSSISFQRKIFGVSVTWFGLYPFVSEVTTEWILRLPLSFCTRTKFTADLAFAHALQVLPYFTTLVIIKLFWVIGLQRHLCSAYFVLILHGHLVMLLKFTQYT